MLHNIIDQLEQNQSDINFISTQVSLLSKQQEVNDTRGYEALTNRVAGIEDTISTNPEKAVSLILLQNDLENVKEQMRTISDYSKWMLGTIITITLALTSLAVSFILRGRMDRANTPKPKVENKKKKRK